MHHSTYTRRETKMLKFGSGLILTFWGTLALLYALDLEGLQSILKWVGLSFIGLGTGLMMLAYVATHEALQAFHDTYGQKPSPFR
jgi:hypothetical protein